MCSVQHVQCAVCMYFILYFHYFQLNDPGKEDLFLVAGNQLHVETPKDLGDLDDLLRHEREREKLNDIAAPEDVSCGALA